VELVTIPPPAPNIVGLAVVDLAPYMRGEISEIRGINPLHGEDGIVIVSRAGMCLSPTSGARQAVAFRTRGNLVPVHLTLDIETSDGTLYHFTTEVVVAVPVQQISYVFLGPTLTYTLPIDGGEVGVRIGVKDTAGNAQDTPRTIFGSTDGGSFVMLNQNYAAREFVWNGVNWSVF
jgi:hypothetical protein